MEEVINNLKFYRSYRFLFVIGITIDGVITIIASVLQHSLLVNPNIGIGVSTVIAIFNQIAFVVLVIVYWIYSKKVFAITPFELESPFRKESTQITYLLAYAATSYTLCSIVQGVAGLKTYNLLQYYPYSFMIVQFIVTTNALFFNIFFFPFWKQILLCMKITSVKTHTPSASQERYRNSQPLELYTI